MDLFHLYQGPFAYTQGPRGGESSLLFFICPDKRLRGESPPPHGNQGQFSRQTSLGSQV